MYPATAQPSDPSNNVRSPTQVPVMMRSPSLVRLEATIMTMNQTAPGMSASPARRVTVQTNQTSPALPARARIGATGERTEPRYVGVRTASATAVAMASRTPTTTPPIR